MQVRYNKVLGQNGLYTSKEYKKGDVIFVLNGYIKYKPSRKSIHIGNNVHIVDDYGSYINHSFKPSVMICGRHVIALHDLSCNTEITFDYNENEVNMANVFECEGKIVCGKTI